MIRRTLLGLVLLAAAAQPGRADPASDRIAQIPAEVEEMRLVGEWSTSGKAGAYRIVVTRSGTTEIRARFYVQWIAYTQAGPSVEASLEIAEVFELGADVKETTVEMDGDRLVLTFDLEGGGAAEGTYEAIVKAPGDYTFQKAGN
ncbi:hypothetical protein [Prosthecomicrobium sp. N25]|uniref:hypothetical protein n=1 Tax=Prosthecomicrobium sp. N25 TaxID=3129254 RepID=UPI003077EC7D